MSTQLVQQGREAFDRETWGDAYDALSGADRAGSLVHADDLERLAVVAHLTGHLEEGNAVRERAVQAFIDAGRPAPAARCAFWLGMQLARRGGEPARAGGWLARARRLVADLPDVVEHGYLLLPRALGAIDGGDPQTAATLFQQIAAHAERADDPDLDALGRLGLGQALLQLGEGARGLALLDEAIVAVQSGAVSPIPAGIIYCAAVDACQRIADLRRAAEWTAELSRWCDAHPGLVPFRGQCLIHRAQVLQIQGRWSAAMTAAVDACHRLADPPGDPAVGAAHYQQAELHRLRGEQAAAEQGYRLASRHGRAPQPGLALLRLAQGRSASATASLSRLLEEGQNPPDKVPLLSAQVAALLDEDRIDEARAAAVEAVEIAETLGSPLLQATAAQALGAVLLAEGRPADALPVLREAWRRWEEQGAPYEAASLRVLLGRVCRAMGDEDGFAFEIDAATLVFQRLGAVTDLQMLDRLRTGTGSKRTGLSDRELQVIRLVADGQPNRSIAAALVISEHTVARHLQNIFLKLGVDSRTAAAAYAYQHDLV